MISAKDGVAAPTNKKVVVPESLRDKVPMGGEQLNKLIRIDPNAMNRRLDNWAGRWRREFEGKR